MTTTKVDEALLVIDVQNEYFTGRLPVTFPEGSLNNILRAMDYAASAGMPVAIIQHSAAAKDSPTFRKGSEEWKLHQEIELQQARYSDRKEPARQLYGNRAGEVAAGHERGTRCHLRLHGADVLRHDGAPGFSFGISGGLSLRCDWNSGCAQQRRSHLGPGSAPGGDGDAGDALCQGDGNC